MVTIRVAYATCASLSKRTDRASRLSLRVNSCITPTERMVIKSRDRLKPIRAGYGQIVDAKFERRVRQLSCGDGHSRDAVAALSCDQERGAACAIFGADSSESDPVVPIGQSDADEGQTKEVVRTRQAGQLCYARHEEWGET